MMIDLGTLGGDESSAEGINETGHIVGRAQTADGTWHAFIWTPDSGMTQIHIPEAVSSYALAINDHGQVTGGFTDDDKNDHVFVWDAVTGTRIIPVPHISPEPCGINDTGQVLMTVFDDSRRIFVWSDAEGLREIGPPYDDTYMEFRAIADNGDIVGWATDPSPWSSAFEFSFIMSLDGRTITIPGLGKPGMQCDYDCRASSINKLGQIAGSIVYTDTQSHVCLWTPSNTPPANPRAARIEISFTVVDKRGNPKKHIDIPHEQIVFTQADDHPTCRFTAIDSKGRPTDYTLELKQGLCYEACAERTITYLILVDMKGNLVRICTHEPNPVSYRITDIGAPDGLSAYARGINNAGQIICSAFDQEHHSRAFLWTKDMGFLDLGTLGGETASACDINDAGTVVGSAVNVHGHKHAFAWHQPAG